MPSPAAEPEELVFFASVDELWSWLEEHHATHAGLWVRLGNARGGLGGVGFHDLLEAGLAFGWSESTRHGHDEVSYLQRFSPRRTRGTASERNRRIVERLEAEGRMTPAGRAALGLG